MKMYCVEHGKNDSNNQYVKTLKEAREIKKELLDAMATGEIDKEEIWLTCGEFDADKGDYYDTEAVE